MHWKRLPSTPFPQPQPLCAILGSGSNGAPSSCNQRVLKHTINKPERIAPPCSPFPPGILTAELLEVGLQLLPGAEEDPALLGAHHEGALVVHGDAGHLGVQLGERGALRRRGRVRAGAVPRVSHPHPSSIIFLCWPKYHGVYGTSYTINTLATLRPHKGTWLRYAKSSWFGLKAFPTFYFSSPKSNHSIVFL